MVAAAGILILWQGFAGNAAFLCHRMAATARILILWQGWEVLVADAGCIRRFSRIGRYCIASSSLVIISGLFPEQL